MNVSLGPRPVQSGITRRHLIVFAGLSTVATGNRSVLAQDKADRGLRVAESIHQEPVVGASRERVYQALTDAQVFDRLVTFSDAAKSMGGERKPARIDARPGGEFALFGGYISGRFIELVPGQLIVQAWRTGGWARGTYSVARFELVAAEKTTRIVFDHGGFPAGQGEHLSQGWYLNYWEPLRQLFA
jgi:activator of HSP90 ATPase